MPALLSQVKAVFEFSEICQTIFLVEARELSYSQFLLKLRVGLNSKQQL